MTKSIGVFGLGLIGMALSTRLLSKGYCVSGYDPDLARSTLLSEAGGRAATPEQLWHTDTLIAAVFDTDQLADVIAKAPGHADRVLICTSTCDPDRMPALEADAALRGIRLIEAPISGTSRDLGAGKVIFLLGGDAATIATLDTLFADLGRAHFPVGAIGNGNRAKLAINLVLGLNRAALAEGLVFAEALGLAPSDFLTLARESAAASAVMDTKGPLMVAQDFAPLGRIAQSAKDFSLIETTADRQGQRLPFAETYLSMMQDCIAHGEADLDNSAILKAIARFGRPDTSSL